MNIYQCYMSQHCFVGKLLIRNGILSFECSEEFHVEKNGESQAFRESMFPVPEPSMWGNLRWVVKLHSSPL